MTEALRHKPVTDEECSIYTPKNISAALAKHYGRGYGGLPIQGPLTEGASVVESEMITNREEYGKKDDPFRNDFVRDVVLYSLAARVSRR